MKKINVMLVGCGRMGKIAAGYLHEKGVNIVGAIDANPALEGLDLGKYAGLDVNLGVKITADLEGVLESTNADVAICALFSSMAENEPVFNKILRHKVNIITTCDESHYSWSTAPEVTRRLDELAKKNGVSLVGCGFQDVFWLHIVHTAAGGMLSLKEIIGNIINNSDDYGPSLSDAYKVGYTIEEFEKAVKEDEEAGGMGAITIATNEALCDKFGLTPIGHKVEVVPYVKDHDVFCKSRNCLIPAGNAVGSTERAVTHTKEGILITNAYNIFVYDDQVGEYDLTSWHLEGTPSVDIDLPRGLTAPLTMSTIVNRIPDAIKAAPGYQPNCNLGAARFHLTELEADLTE